MLFISNYIKINVKVIACYIAAIVLCVFFISLTILNVVDNFEFYNNSVRVTGKVQKVIQDERDSSKKVIRVVYEVDGKGYTTDIVSKDSTTEKYKASDSMSLFYNSKDPNDCRTTTRSVISIYLIIGILTIICSIALFKMIKYILNTKMYEKILNSKNFIMTRFEAVKTVTNIYGKHDSNNYYIVSKYKKNDKEYLFKSDIFSKMPEELNINSEIKVFVDRNNYKKYIVDIEKFL